MPSYQCEEPISYESSPRLKRPEFDLAMATAHAARAIVMSRCGTDLGTFELRENGSVRADDLNAPEIRDTVGSIAAHLLALDALDGLHQRQGMSVELFREIEQDMLESHRAQLGPANIHLAEPAARRWVHDLIADPRDENRRDRWHRDVAALAGALLQSEMPVNITSSLRHLGFMDPEWIIGR